MAALPADKVAIEREVVLAEGSRNILVLEPVYGAKPMIRPRASNVTDFKEGIRSLRVMLNGDAI